MGGNQSRSSSSLASLSAGNEAFLAIHFPNDVSPQSRILQNALLEILRIDKYSRIEEKAIIQRPI
jgi:hypothetical protein